MKRVGILTFHRAENFGAVMQAFALQTVVQRMGNQCGVVDYRSRAIECNYDIFNPSILWSRKNIIKSLHGYFSRFKNINERICKKRGYELFRSKHLDLIPYADAANQDILITGSDQVWNLHLTGGFDSNYFLCKKTFQGIRKISYAASSDIDPYHLLEKSSSLVSSALNDFFAVSVRESFLKEILEKKCEKEISVCLDPSLLLDASEYEQIAESPAKKGYCLVYHMSKSSETIRLGKRIADYDGIGLVEIFGGYADRTQKSDIIAAPSPAELLGWIMAADSIVTTSFHGIAFSLIFKKNFWVVDAGNNFRQRNILKLLNLEHRMINSSEDADIDERIDYSVVIPILENLKQDACSFLNAALN